jgi:hypothetical protein
MHPLRRLHRRCTANKFTFFIWVRSKLHLYVSASLLRIDAGVEISTKYMFEVCFLRTRMPKLFGLMLIGKVTVPDRRRLILLRVVLVRRWVTWVLGIWRGEGLGKGLGKGRSVYKQPVTEVDGSCHS